MKNCLCTYLNRTRACVAGFILGALAPVFLGNPATARTATPDEDSVIVSDEMREEAPAGSFKDVPLTEEEVLDFVGRLIAANRLDDALRIIDLVEPHTRKPLQLLFLRGQIAAAREDHDAAIEYYRRILDKNPNLTRVKLELARSLFARHRHAAAIRHLRDVRASRPPKQVLDNIDQFLRIINQSRRWSVTLSISAVPDSNITSGPDESVIVINDTPFVLNADGQSIGALGFHAGFTTNYLQPLNPKTALEVSAVASHTEFFDQGFDDTFLGLQAGPHWSNGSVRYRLLATAYQRWFDGTSFNTSYGGQAGFSHAMNERLIVSGEINVSIVDFARNDGKDGWRAALNLQSLFRLTAIDQSRLILGFAREQAKAAPERNNQWRLGLGYERDFPWGLSASFSTEGSFRSFEGHSPFFGKSREDVTWMVRAGILKRDWRVFGFAPTLSYQYTNNHSNLPVFEFDRHRLEVGYTRDF